jgi:hypothetical protein
MSVLAGDGNTRTVSPRRGSYSGIESSASVAGDVVRHGGSVRGHELAVRFGGHAAVDGGVHRPALVETLLCLPDLLVEALGQ